MKWIITIISCLATASVVAFFCSGSAPVEAQPSQDRFEEGYQVGYTTGYQQGYLDHDDYGEVVTYVDRDVVTYVDREVVTYVDREVVREVTVNQTLLLRDFASPQELKAWLAVDDTNEFVFLFTDAKGIAVRSDRYDCDDYARQLQRRAADSGYLMSLLIVSGAGGPHMINSVIIEDSVYYVEPQTDMYWHYCELD